MHVRFRIAFCIQRRWMISFHPKSNFSAGVPTCAISQVGRSPSHPRVRQAKHVTLHRSFDESDDVPRCFRSLRHSSPNSTKALLVLSKFLHYTLSSSLPPLGPSDTPIDALSRHELQVAFGTSRSHLGVYLALVTNCSLLFRHVVRHLWQCSSTLASETKMYKVIKLTCYHGWLLLRIWW